MTDPNDDLAGSKPPYKVVACLAVLGRLPLLEITIKRLYRVNGCHKVICSGHLKEDRELCESLGAVWVSSLNKPLGRKWNDSFQAAKEFNPDAVLYVGSSDWLSADWIPNMKPLVEQHHFAGTAGCYFLDIQQERRAVWWPGYKATRFHKDRSDETIGIGRMISGSLMDKVEWKPFYDHYDNSLDRSMKEKCKAKGYDDFMAEGSQMAVSISLPKRWVNKHNFEYQWAQATEGERMENADEWCKQHFPEALTL